MKCKYCKRELAENSIYCNWCGKKQFSSKGEINVPKARQLPSGKWFIQLRSGGRSVSITEDTEEACVLKAKATKAGLISQKKAAPDITLGAAIDDFIRKNSPRLSPSTKRGYSIIRRNRAPDLMSKKVSAITQQAFSLSVNNALLSQSPKTVKNTYSFINTVIRDVANTAFEIKLPSYKSKERPFLSPTQIPIFLEAIKDTNIEIPCLLGLWSCRCSEIYGISRDCIDMDRRIIRIAQTVVPDESNHLVRRNNTKNKSSTRKIPICKRLYQLLAKALQDSGPLIPISQTTLYRKINHICEKNNLPKIGIHGLRHSFASLGYSLNIPEKYLMEIGGWEDDKTMRNIYTHIAREDINHYEGAMLDFYNKVE